MRTLSMIALTLCGAACTERELGTLSETEAQALYISVKSELRNVHSLALGVERPEPNYTYGCAEGTIDLRISLDRDMQPVALRHSLDACSVSGLMLDGSVNYIDLDPCEEPGTFSFQIGARIEVGGEMNGFCFFEAHDKCGNLTGHLCGYSADIADEL